MNTSEIKDIIELSATAFFINSGSIKNCLAVKYTMYAVGAEAITTEELSR